MYIFSIDTHLYSSVIPPQLDAEGDMADMTIC